MILSLVLSSIDGNWVDIGSFITGFIYIIWLRCSGSRTVPFLSKNTAFDFANGLSVFPLILLTLSPIASVLMKGLVDASKISLGVAGMFSLFAILEDGTSNKKAKPQPINQ
jgi:hypothetical protein